MKIKKIIVMIILVSLPIIIYVISINNKIDYISLGDSLALGVNPYDNIGYGYSDYVSNYLKTNKLLNFYTKTYAKKDYRTTDLIKDINNNVRVNADGKIITIKNALTKADVITVSIGINDILYKLGINNLDVPVDIDASKRYVDDVMSDINNLMVLIRKYCKEDIIILGYYNPLYEKHSSYAKEVEPVFLYANRILKSISDKNNIYFIDLYKDFKHNNEYLPNPIDIHPSDKGYYAIASKIIDIINKKVIND